MMKKKIALMLVAGFCLLNTVPCFASQSVKISVTDTKEAQYTTLPDAETLQKDAGFSPKTPAILAGGYQFAEGDIIQLIDTDANGVETSRRKGISFRYTKTDRHSTRTAVLSAETAGNQSISENSTLIKYGEFTLYYSDVQANSVSWTDGGVLYNLMDITKAVSKDELVDMAKGMVDMDTAPDRTGDQHR